MNIQLFFRSIPIQQARHLASQTNTSPFEKGSAFAKASADRLVHRSFSAGGGLRGI